MLAQPIVKRALRLVVLNACLSAPQAELIARVIDGVVVGMSAEVTDEAAVAFARGLDTGIGRGLDLEQSFQLGRSEVAVSGDPPEAVTPQAFARQGVEAGAIRILDA